MRHPIEMTHFMTREGSKEVRVLDMKTGKSRLAKCGCGRRIQNCPNIRCESCDASYWEGYRRGVRDAEAQIRKLLQPRRRRMILAISIVSFAFSLFSLGYALWVRRQVQKRALARAKWRAAYRHGAILDAFVLAAPEPGNPENRPAETGGGDAS